MMSKYKKWLLNAPIRKKFIPIEITVMLLIIIIALASVSSLLIINSLSQKIFTENVESVEMLTEITETMYICRVLGRDILFEENEDLRLSLYDQYIAAFNELDKQMDTFVKRLEGEELEIFRDIILEKNKYKVSMILSADLKIKGDKDAEALEALQVVTPIANLFFGRIDQFLTYEKQLMAAALEENNETVVLVIIIDVIVGIVVAFLFFIMIKSFIKTTTNSLILLEQSVSEIANTGNMNIDIPKELYTNDEIGKIATATNKLKTMLLDHSFKDALTGGYNSSAYFEELSNILDDFEFGNPKIEFWCLIFDMNHLKLINDDYGHAEGDSAIKLAHKIITGSFSEYGKTFRIGGDEFVSILTKCQQYDIEEGLNNMESAIEESNQKLSYCLSIAWGYEKFEGTTKAEFEECFKVIDKQMYKHKNRSKAHE